MPRDSSVTGQRGIMKGLSSLSPNNKIAPVARKQSQNTPGFADGSKTQRKVPMRENKSPLLAPKQSRLSRGSSRSSNYDTGGSRSKSVSLIKQQSAGDQIPGWHKIEEGKEDEEYDDENSQNSDFVDEHYFKTQESRLTSQPAAVDSGYIDFIDEIGNKNRFSITEQKEL